jgi:purine-binding chemotaxis protein CheW
MGRLADARKRARRPGVAGEQSPGASAPTAGGPPEPPEVPRNAPSAAPARTPVEPRAAESAEPAPEAARIQLPPSGLAEDILAREDAARVTAISPELAAETLPVKVAPGGRAASFSFFASPARDERVEVEATEHLATFFMGREEYGVDVRLVQEIRRLSEITQVPRAPAFIEGVINLRGRIIPVIDLKKKLGIGKVEATKTSRIVVVRLLDRLLGLLVDGASQVLRVPISRIEPPPAEVLDQGDESIRGVAKLEARLIILLDLPRILELELREGGAVGRG